MYPLRYRGFVSEAKDADEWDHDQGPDQQRGCNGDRGDEPKLPFDGTRETGEKIPNDVDDTEEAALDHQDGYVIFFDLGIWCVKS